MRKLILPLFLLSQTALAKMPEGTYKFMSDTEFATAHKEAIDRAGRKIASVQDFEKRLSKEYKEFRKVFLNLKDVKEIDPLIAKLEKEYDSYPTDLKLAAAQIIPLKHFKGMIYRVRGVVEKSKMLHSQLLTGVMNLANNVETYFPDQEAGVLFDYAALPYDGVVQFKQSKDIQIHLTENVYPALDKAAKRIQELDLSQEVVLDNKLFYGDSSFTDELDRYRLIGKAEQHLMLHRRNRGLAALCRNNAYNGNGLVDLVSDIGKLYGVDGFKSQVLHKDVNGVTLQDQAKEIKKKKNLFTLNSDGQTLMNKSFNHLKESIYQLDLAWQEANSRKNSSGYVINADAFTARERGIGKSIEIYKQIVAGPIELHSRISKEIVTVDLPAFYHNAPSDLKVLLPTEFDDGPKERTISIKNKEGKSVNVSYYNYYRGRPIGWNGKAYSTIFPNAKDREDLTRTSRIVSQSWGGEMVGAALKVFIQ